MNENEEELPNHGPSLGFPLAVSRYISVSMHMTDELDFNEEVHASFLEPLWKPCAGIPPPCACSATLAESRVMARL
jgi:hypothetical protein